MWNQDAPPMPSVEDRDDDLREPGWVEDLMAEWEEETYVTSLGGLLDEAA